MFSVRKLRFATSGKSTCHVACRVLHFVAYFATQLILPASEHLKGVAVKLFKRTVLASACLAMTLSVAPLFGIFNQTEDHGDGGSSDWTVTCTYDSQEILVSKSCTSGGTKSCKCP